MRPVNLQGDDLHEIPITLVQRVRFEPGDTLVLTCDGHLSEEGMARLRQTVVRIVPYTQVLVLEGGLSLAAVLTSSSNEGSDGSV